jgi:hypothetical protein
VLRGLVLPQRRIPSSAPVCTVHVTGDPVPVNTCPIAAPACGAKTMIANSDPIVAANAVRQIRRRAPTL